MIKNLIFIGPPGVGKGTLAKLLEKEKEIIHISTGDIFRKEIEQETELGNKVKFILNSGEYVPDAITNEIVKKVLLSPEVKEKGFILDGYPRTINQANFLKENNFNIDTVVVLEADIEIIKNRILSRSRGSDDTIEIIKKRIEVYHEKTEPIIDYYKKNNTVKFINSEGTIKENFNKLIKEVF